MLELLGRRLRAAASATRCFSVAAASRATHSRPKCDSNRASAWRSSGQGSDRERAHQRHELGIDTRPAVQQITHSRFRAHGL